MFLLFISHFTGHFTSRRALGNQEKEQRWTWETPEQPSHSPEMNIAMIAHGINLNPEKMNEIGVYWKNRGFYVSYLKLSGHLPQEKKIFSQVSAKIWEQETLNWLSFIVSQRGNKTGKTVFVGFSLGAIAFLNAWIKPPLHEPAGKQFEVGLHVDSFVLYAPAIQTHWYTKLPKYLFNSLLIPSGNLPEYRAHNATPVSAYRALFQLQENLLLTAQGRKVQERLNIPSLVFLEPHDELVSYGNTLEWISHLGLNKWQPRAVSATQSVLDRKFKHLIIDSKSVGNSEWFRMNQFISEFIPNH
jgi:hypothetical protein